MANSPTQTTIGVRITRTLKARIDKEAAAQHRTVSNLVATILFERFGDDASRLNGTEHKAPKVRASV